MAFGDIPHLPKKLLLLGPKRDLHVRRLLLGGQGKGLYLCLFLGFDFLSERCTEAAKD